MNIRTHIHTNGWCEYKIGSGEPIIMLHGFGYSAEIMFPLALILSNYFEIRLFDLPGMGQSISNISEISLDSITSALALLVPDKAHYLGWSLGGLFTQYYAYKFPDKTNKLISVATTPCFMEHDHWPGLSSIILNQFKNNLHLNFEATLKKFIWEQLYDRNKALYLDIVELVFKNIVRFKNVYSVYLDLLININLIPYLPSINVQQLYLTGTNDILVPSNLNLEPYNKNIKQIQLNCGHLPFVSHLNETALIIKDFLYAK
ncbi:MAG: alpha/beta fold hydrolase [Gammaproteobacteria bacterium]